MKVGYSFYSIKIPWVVSYKRAFENGMKEHINYEISWLDGNSDSKAIAAGVEKWTAQKLDLIVSMSPDHVPLRMKYKKTLEAGIPVLLTGEPPDYRVYEFMTAFSGLSAWEGGRMAADLLNQTLGGRGQVACITGPRGSASEQQNTEGFKASLQRLASKIQIAATEDGKWDATASYQRALSILTRFPKLDAIYASEDAMGSAVIRALKEKGYTPGQVKVVALGGSRGAVADLKAGWYLGIVNQDPSLCAQQDIWFMRALLEENRRLPRAAQAPQEMITKENADQFAGW
jgi:ribose transport system substrate-binding protein